MTTNENERMSTLGKVSAKAKARILGIEIIELRVAAASFIDLEQSLMTWRGYCRRKSVGGASLGLSVVPLQRLKEVSQAGEGLESGSIPLHIILRHIFELVACPVTFKIYLNL